MNEGILHCYIHILDGFPATVNLRSDNAKDQEILLDDIDDSVLNDVVG